MDIPFVGANFTWNNNHLGGTEVKQRIDRGLCNYGWSTLYPQCHIKHKTRTKSDHCPVVFAYDADINKTRPRRFYYENGWREAEGYHDCVVQNWKRGDSSNKNLKDLSKKLTTWKREMVGANKERINHILSELQRLENLESTESRQTEQKELRDSLKVCWKIEESYWSQRARVQWLRLGDKNTRFFHASTVQRRKRNTILGLRGNEGEWIEDSGELGEHITSFYKGLFSAEKNVVDFSILNGYPMVIDETTRERLDRRVTEPEIKTAVFQIGPSKSSGPDGYPGSFFQNHWPLEMLESGYTGGNLPRGDCEGDPQNSRGSSEL
ncbi:Transposon TX1 uncharacterized 149 kDa protein [Linum perenne]